jgi:hypothetical protein
MPLLTMYEVNPDCVIFQVIKMDVYFYVSMNGKYVCFICNKGIAIQKEYNIANHYNLKLKVHKLLLFIGEDMRYHFKLGGFRDNKMSSENNPVIVLCIMGKLSCCSPLS